MIAWTGATTPPWSGKDLDCQALPQGPREVEAPTVPSHRLPELVRCCDPRTTEKRTYVDIRSIQEFIDVNTIFWTPTFLMWADGLTKCSKSLRDEMARWLAKPYVQLKDQSEGHMKESKTRDNVEHSEPPAS